MATKMTNRLKSAALVSKAVDTFYAELREAPKQGKLVAWCDGFPLPFPILRAMDIPYFYGDAYAASVAGKHIEKDLQKVSEDRGYIVEICSYTRNTMGCALYPEEDRAKAHPWYQIPKPNFIVVADSGCSMMVNWGDDERRRFGVPFFIIQIPHVWEGDEEADAVVETARQLREFITFLEDTTHRKFDWDRLKAIMASVKEATIYRKQGMQICKAIPSPATLFDWATSLAGVNYMLGEQRCVDVYGAMKNEVAERATRKEGAVVDEQYRLYWDGIVCWPKLGHLADKFANLGACVVAGRYTHMGFYSVPEKIDPEKPLESMAENTVVLHFNHNIDWLIDNVSRMCQEYSLDGLISHAHRTCRIIAATQLELMDGVSRRLGIPYAFFESDMADETFYSEGQVDTRIQALVESIAAKKRR